MKTLELKGYKALRALNVFHSLMLGLKMLPAYVVEGYEEFFERVKQMSELEQENMIREAALFVKLDRDEMEAMLTFVLDQNGVPYQPANIGNLSLEEIYEGIVAVAKEIAKIKIGFVTDTEKKN